MFFQAAFNISTKYNQGVTVQTVGKLRLFNDRLSLISFYVREVVSEDEIEIFQLEAKLANIYYQKVFFI